MIIYSQKKRKMGNNQKVGVICHANTNVRGPSDLQLKQNQTDEPLPEFAKPVNAHIDVHHKVKEVHMIYKPHHTAERKGFKLGLHYLFDYCAYYEGEWKNGLPHGSGRLIYDDGSVYEGCFKGGVADCKDALFIKDETVFYKGAIKNNKANGYGQLATPKHFYKGHWVDDMPQGKAREIYSSVSFYEGNFVDGEKSGDGIYQWNKQQFYIGKFFKNHFDGEGDLTTKEYQYRGTFSMGRKEGKGIYKDLSGKFIYKGMFKNNKPFGEGQITYSDDAVMKGKFDGFETVEGILTLPSGQTVPVNVSSTNGSENET